ncbi:class I SAM-dependent methyltransferase [Candidatus Thorarchaeota archaeon]|nr:MAG: class I SAM-dependent methyltransferase [Candidatus Thorarchaeota archaeon]
MSDPIEEQWQVNSKAFADLIGGTGTPHHQDILVPCLDRLIGDITGKQLLDAGCGEGYLSRRYAQKGAIVTGVDISSKLIDFCELNAMENTKFHIGDICNLNESDGDSFDFVLCNLVLLNIPCLDDALREFHRVLRGNGILVFSLVHPAFNFYGPGTWEMGEKDPETRRRKGLFFKIDNYFDEQEYQRYWRTRNGEKFPAPISFFHRTISTYTNAVTGAGFQILEIAEPKPVVDDDFFDRERRIPFFMVIKAKKL